MITLKIPNKIGESHAPILVKKGKSLLGPLGNPPKVLSGKLIAPPIVLSVRGWDGTGPNLRGADRVSIYVNGLGHRMMEVHYGEQHATYKLFEDRIIYSDGPPHPDHLQLAVRVHRTEGIVDAFDEGRVGEADPEKESAPLRAA
jgi:hypothetical protein